MVGEEKELRNVEKEKTEVKRRKNMREEERWGRGNRGKAGRDGRNHFICSLQINRPTKKE